MKMGRVLKAVSSSTTIFILATPSLSGHTTAFMPPSKPSCSYQFSPVGPFIQSRCGGEHDGKRDVSLYGFRAFIKKRIFRRDGGVGDREDYVKNADGESNRDIDLRTILQSPASAGLMETPWKTSECVDSTDGNDADTLEKDGIGHINASTAVTGNSNKKGKNGKKKDTKEEVLTLDMKLRLQEDARERVQRVQSGGMTEEEKMAFLNAALTRTPPQKKPRGPPIRQQIPQGADDDGNDDLNSENSGKDKIFGEKNASAHSSTENLWNAIVGRDIQKNKVHASGRVGVQPAIPVSPLIVGGKFKSEEAKRQWIDSITNPDRFISFSSIQKSSQPSKSFEEETDSEEGEAFRSKDVRADTPSNKPDFIEMKRRIAEDQKRYMNATPEDQEGQNVVREALESLKSMAGMSATKGSSNSASSSQTMDAKATNNNQINDLAKRLEQAAAEQEKCDADARQEAKTKLQNEKRALAELQKQREEIFLRQEAERIKMAQKQAEELRRQEEAKKREDQAKLEAMQAQQDAYWSKKLEKERAKKDSKLTSEERREKEQEGIVRSRENEERIERGVAEEVKLEAIREEERMREDKHEGEILREADEEKNHDRELVRDIVTESAAKVSRTVPENSIENVAVSKFVSKQRQKKEELDKLRQMEQLQLKSLNSPLPSTQKNPIAMSPSPPNHLTTSLTTAPKPARPSSRALSLANLTMKKSGSSGEPSSPTSLLTKLAPNLSLSELTRLKSKDDTKRTAAPPTSSSSQRLNLIKKTKQKKDSDDKPTATAKHQGVKSHVRQQLPITSWAIIGDNEADDDDDDDDLTRTPGASRLTIGDWKQNRKNEGSSKRKENSGGDGKDSQSEIDRAKQWGIDMSKFK